MATIIVYIAGIYSLGFAIFHLGFWKIFGWKDELPKLRYVNRAIMQILNTRLTYFLLCCACLCFFFTDELLHTRLGHVVLAGLALFWAGRTAEQFIFFKGYLFNLIFLLGTMLFSIPLFL
ncbi:hypothetical protein [Chitinophaga niabensis]|uniref:Uncharacterized protein n=1 Tax=Chitinophaga niabensis TaxID=536979 RepID=A0A1N6DB99_9BACT|nr:hypothetical protein [Chitinophaga niabensis]SIN67956.1 hypothetical protein SAMN04488055_0558 [Chitinophaga niabensis]